MNLELQRFYMLTNGNILKQKIDSLWDKFWSGGNVTRNSFRATEN